MCDSALDWELPTDTCQWSVEDYVRAAEEHRIIKKEQDYLNETLCECGRLRGWE